MEVTDQTVPCFLRDSLPSLGLSSLRGLKNGSYLTIYLDNFSSFLIDSYRIPPAPLSPTALTASSQTIELLTNPFYLLLSYCRYVGSQPVLECDMKRDVECDDTAVAAYVGVNQPLC